MKIKYLILALCPLTFTACQSIQGNSSSHQISQINPAQQLTDYAWVYTQSKASRPLVLQFLSQQRLSIKTGCNGQNGSWKIEDGNILTSNLISTRMACANDLMQQENFSAGLLSQKKVPFSISTSNGKPLLTLTDTNGKKHVFEGTKAVSPNTLTDYIWSYQPKETNQPIQLRFSGQELYISTGCNSQAGMFKTENDKLITTVLRSTRKACSPELMKQEQLAASLFNKQSTTYVIDDRNKSRPTLTVTSANGQKYTFIGEITPEAKYQTQGETIFLEISPETKPCSGVAKQNCLQVREIKYSAKGGKTYVNPQWTLFYDQIEGFQHNPQQRVILRVKRYKIGQPAADQSKYAYVHDLTVEQEMVKKP